MASPLNIVSTVDHQKKTYWDFFLADNPLFKYRVKSCTLPLPKFEIETRHTWENFYKTLNITTTIDIEIYEDIAFSTYRYFQVWRGLVYNSFTRKFNSYPGTLPETCPIYKTAIFGYYATGSIIQPIPTKVFTFRNVKLVGLSDVTNTYEDGSALTYTVTIAFEDVIDT